MSNQKSTRSPRFAPKIQARSAVSRQTEPSPTPELEPEIAQAEETPGPDLQRLSSGHLDKGNLLYLQRTIGNQAVQRILKEKKTDSSGSGSSVQRDLLAAGSWQTKTKGSLFKKRGKTNPIIVELDQLITNYNNATSVNKPGALGAIKNKIEPWLSSPKNKKNSRRGVVTELLDDVKDAISKIPPPTPTPPTPTPPSPTSDTTSGGSVPSTTTTTPPSVTSTTDTATVPTLPTLTPPTTDSGSDTTTTTAPTTVSGDTTPETAPTTTPTTTPPVPVTATSIMSELNGATNETAITNLLTGYKTGNVTWATFSAAMKTVSDTVKTKIRGNATALGKYFELASTGIDKGEGLYLIGGDRVWKETAMTTYTISNNDQREGLVRLNVFESGTAGHKDATEVDTLIGTHLATFVQNNLTSRGKIEGRLAVLAEADWNVIGRSDYGVTVWEGGKKNTLNAFVDRSSDPPRIFVNKDRGNAGTAIHEGCHFWGHSSRPINSASHDLNEGVTEYFARKICSALTPPIPRTVYGNQFKVANQLITLVGEDVAGAAFFDADMEGLKTAFNDKQGVGKWDQFIEKVEAKEWNAAVALATGAPTTSTTVTVTAGTGTTPTPGSLAPVTATDDH